MTRIPATTTPATPVPSPETAPPKIAAPENGVPGTAVPRTTAAESTAGADGLLADGTVIHIRPPGAADGRQLADLYRRASPDALRLRFFGYPSAATISQEVARLTRPPQAGHAALVAEADGRIVAAAAYERVAPESGDADFAVFVDETVQGRGVGTLLLENLAAAARTDGVERLTGQVLATNSRMLHVARDLTARATVTDDGTVDVDLPTVTVGTALAAADERERVAETLSLRPLFAPRSVAVVGASRTPGGVGHETLRALAAYGFNGTLFPVNPAGGYIAGLPAVASLRALPGLVDLAVLAVPADCLPAVVTDAAESGVRAAVILSAGVDDELRRRLLRIARPHSLRLLGPDSVGLINTAGTVRLNASYAAEAPIAGPVAVAAQSGAVGLTLLAGLRRGGCGVSAFVSLGDKADLSGNDLLAYWHDDPRTRAVVLALESFGNPRRFARLVRTLGRRKPVLAVRQAPTTIPAIAADRLYAQAGVITAGTLGELVDAARLLGCQPVPDGDRVQIIGNAGSLQTLAADIARAEGLTVSGDVRLPGDVTPRQLATAVGALPPADLVLVVLVGSGVNDAPGLAAAAGDALDDRPAVTAACVLTGLDATTVGGLHRPVYAYPDQAVRALAKAARYASWRRLPTGLPAHRDDIDQAAAAELVAQGLDSRTDPPADRLLSCYGITPAGLPACEAVVVHDPLFGSLVGLRTAGEFAYCLTPVDECDARRLWRDLAAAADLAWSADALEEFTVRLSLLAADLPEVARLTVRVDGAGGWYPTVRLRAVLDEPDPVVRRLRPA